MDIQVGTLLCNKYEIIRVLGSGGSGRVFEARHLTLAKPVTVKVLPRGAAGGVLARREALAGAIRSPHVVEIYDIDQDEGHDALIIVMEFLEGASLQAILDEKGKLTEDEAATVLRQTLAGMARAHARGIIHGDLKPGNIYCVDRQGDERVVILDFGIASIEDSVSPALRQTVGGTPLWMNREAIQGRDRTWRADTWAIGLLAYQMLAGNPYWQATTLNELMREIIEGPKFRPTELGTLHGNVLPAWLDAFFAATVNANEAALRPAAELLALLPVTVTAIPSRGTVHVPVAMNTAVDQLATTAVTQNVNDLPGLFTQSPKDSSLDASLLQILPESMRSSAPEIRSFIETLFADTTLDGRVLRLRGPRLDFAKAYEFCLIALGSSQKGSIRTMTFVGYTKGLEEILERLERTTLKVVIVLVDTTELGLGVRARIAHLFRTHRAALIPAFIRDLTNLSPKEATDWLKRRWQANRPVTNPFEPGVLDRTLLHGHWGVVNRFVDELGGSSSVFGVYGAPGTGKTSLVRRVESEVSEQVDCHWISCGMLPEAAVAKTFLERAADTFRVPFQMIDGRPVDTFTLGVTGALVAARQSGKRLVVVLDDADLLVDPTLPGTTEDDRRFLFDLRQQIAKLLDGEGIAFVLIGLRSFILGREQIGGKPNPLRRYFRGIRVPPFGFEETKALCHLGRQVDLDFNDDAIQRVQLWASGHVHVVQMICSKLVELSSDGAITSVDAKAVDAAAAELIAARQSFERRVMPWLMDVEKMVLATVPRVGFKRPLDLTAVLPGFSDETIGNALDHLVEMGLLTRSGGKPRIAGKLLESWILTHMSPPEGAMQRKRERSLRIATAGVFVTALLYAAGSILFGTGEQPVEVTARSCKTFAAFPKRVVASDKIQVLIARECTAPVPGNIELRAADRTIAWFDVRGQRGDTYERPVAGNETRVQDDVTIIDMRSTDTMYAFRLSVDGQSEIVTIGRNRLGELPGLLRGLIVVAGAVPALIGLVLGFLSDIRRAIDKMFSKPRDA